MADVANLMKLPHKEPRRRREYVARLLRRLEKRDQTEYLRRFGTGEGKLYVAVSALEQLMPWDPGTLTAVRDDVDTLGTRMKRVERRVDGHDKDIERLRLAGQKLAEAQQLLSEASGA